MAHDFTPSDEVTSLIDAVRSPEVYQRKIAPEKSALLIVDMQAAFVEQGLLTSIPAADSIIDTINDLARDLRGAGGHIVWLRMTAPQDFEAETTLREWYRFFLNDTARAEYCRLLNPAGTHHHIADGLECRGEDHVTDKRMTSPFTPGSSDLDEHLRSRGVETVIVAGTVSNGCCESTARDAAMLGYRLYLASDANAALSDQDHTAAMNNIALYFGIVATAADITARFEPSA